MRAPCPSGTWPYSGHRAGERPRTEIQRLTITVDRSHRAERSAVAPQTPGRFPIVTVLSHGGCHAIANQFAFLRSIRNPDTDMHTCLWDYRVRTRRCAVGLTGKRADMSNHPPLFFEGVRPVFRWREPHQRLRDCPSPLTLTRPAGIGTAASAALRGFSSAAMPPTESDSSRPRFAAVRHLCWAVLPLQGRTAARRRCSPSSPAERPHRSELSATRLLHFRCGIPSTTNNSARLVEQRGGLLMPIRHGAAGLLRLRDTTPAPEVGEGEEPRLCERASHWCRGVLTAGGRPAPRPWRPAPSAPGWRSWRCRRRSPRPASPFRGRSTCRDHEHRPAGGVEYGLAHLPRPAPSGLYTLHDGTPARPRGEQE